uniref:Uncharacterized protein n=1 Tax=Globodera rostochiensis TaxID=31243 RepID=A0A914H6A8_GLORO
MEEYQNEHQDALLETVFMLEKYHLMNTRISEGNKSNPQMLLLINGQIRFQMIFQLQFWLLDVPIKRLVPPSHIVNPPWLLFQTLPTAPLMMLENSNISFVP